MTYRIDQAICINCSLCRQACPTGAIKYYSTGRRIHLVEEQWCIDCDLCAQACPVDCIDSLPELRPEPAQLELARERAREFARAGRSSAIQVRDEARRVVALRRERRP